MIGRIALAVSALLAAPVAAAQSIPDTVEGIATDLAYGYCPQYLAGTFPLTDNDQLKALGFAGAEQSQPNARFGTIKFVAQKRDGLEFSFGGVPGQVCQVNMIGATSAATLAKIRGSLHMMSFDFQPDPANSGLRPNGVKVETLKAKMDEKNIVRVQFVTATLQGQPFANFQIFAMDQ